MTQSLPPRRVQGSALRATLVNHATVLLQQNSSNILTDPIWSERAGPFPWVGPGRHRIPGVSWEDVPPIDFVLLTHNHYDHLDVPSLRRLVKRANPVFIVPLRCGRLLQAEDIAPVHELDWGQSISLSSATFHCVPAQHFSGRSLSDRNTTLWCGYIIEAQNRRIYFAGDTAFGPHFAAIRNTFGSPHVAFLPIGAYEPRWFMSPVHMAPDEALQAHGILAPALSIAIHHGTFQLTDESIDTPAKELIANAGGAKFLVLNNGQFTEIP